MKQRKASAQHTAHPPYLFVCTNRINLKSVCTIDYFWHFPNGIKGSHIRCQVNFGCLSLFVQQIEIRLRMQIFDSSMQTLLSYSCRNKYAYLLSYISECVCICVWKLWATCLLAANSIRFRFQLQFCMSAYTHKYIYILVQ